MAWCCKTKQRSAFPRRGCVAQGIGSITLSAHNSFCFHHRHRLRKPKDSGAQGESKQLAQIKNRKGGTPGGCWGELAAPWVK